MTEYQENGQQQNLGIQVPVETLTKALQDSYSGLLNNQITEAARFRAGLATAEGIIAGLQAENADLKRENARLVRQADLLPDAMELD